jgi:hypothetical protein
MDGSTATRNARSKSHSRTVAFAPGYWMRGLANLGTRDAKLECGLVPCSNQCWQLEPIPPC